jgi:hypothetical protein
MQYPQIFQAKAINDHTLIIEFTNQEVKKYDIYHLLENPLFAPLRQPAFFRNFKIEKGGYGIVWNEDIDLSEYELWKNGIIVSNRELRVPFGF